MELSDFIGNVNFLNLIHVIILIYPFMILKFAERYVKQ